MISFADERGTFNTPTTHDIAFTSKNLSQAADNDICVRKHTNIHKIAYGFIHHDSKAKAVG